jgi:AcrR family transcriptional regulator
MSAAITSKGEITRDAIIESANALFVSRGYNATSMRVIAQTAGIALSGIYNHFASKEEIFEVVFLENHPFLEMLPAIEAAQGDTVEEFIRDAAQKMLNAIHSRPGFLNLMFIEIVEFKSIHAQVMFEVAFPSGLQIIRKFSEMEGNLRPIPPQMLIRAFMGMFFSYYLAEVILGDVAPPEFKENAMDYQVDILLHGIVES